MLDFYNKKLKNLFFKIFIFNNCDQIRLNKRFQKYQYFFLYNDGEYLALNHRKFKMLDNYKKKQIKADFDKIIYYN